MRTTTRSTQEGIKDSDVMIFEKIQGVTLNKVRDNKMAIALKLIEKVRELHKLGFTHGDISPGNVIINDIINVIINDFKVTIIDYEYANQRPLSKDLDDLAKTLFNFFYDPNDIGLFLEGSLPIRIGMTLDELAHGVTLIIIFTREIKANLYRGIFQDRKVIIKYNALPLEVMLNRVLGNVVLMEDPMIIEDRNYNFIKFNKDTVTYLVGLVEYLHINGLRHGNLSFDNILVGDNMMLINPGTDDDIDRLCIIITSVYYNVSWDNAINLLDQGKSLVNKNMSLKDIKNAIK
jgi:tRNA A-37 threonylcarbamoyl transferase component Bud32